MDPQKCLDILSQRTPHETADPSSSTEHTHSNGGNHADHCCGCTSNGDGGLPIGQVIDLSSSTPSPATAAPAAEPASAPAAAAAAKNSEALAAELAAMSTSDIIRAFQQAQSDRVRAYSRFDSCLDAMLTNPAGGNSSSTATAPCAAYPALCAEMTATFAVLSAGIRAMKGALESRRNGDVTAGTAAALLGRVQALESQKLTATAALHLERMRRGTVYWGESDDGGAAAALLDGGAVELRATVAALAAQVAEAMEELRYELE